MKTTLQNNSPKRCTGFLAEKMDGEIVLLHPARNIIVHANETAALVWQMCDGINTMDQIVEVLGSAYPYDRGQIEKDVPEIIQKLREQGVLDCD